jgi:uncharacterized protein (TIGR04255 family)
MTIIYKYAPLIETVFEIRFPEEPAIECNKDKFYDKVRNDYSRVLIPSMSFEKEDETSGISLSINKLAFYCRKYDGFKSFKEEAIKILNIFKTLFKVKKLNRTGLRYINAMPYTREKYNIPLKNFLNIKIDLPKSIQTDFENFNIAFDSKSGNGNIATRIYSAISDDKIQEAIILDFDYSKKENLVFDSIEKYLDESHKHTKKYFEGLITDDYRKIMLGEVI